MKISLFVYLPKIILEAKTENKNFLKIPERFTTFKSVWQKYQKIFLLNKNSLLRKHSTYWLILQAAVIEWL